MIIDLSSIGTEPKKIEKTFEPEDIDLTGEDLKLTAPVKLVGEVVRLATKANLSGRISTQISRDCTRCLEPVSGDLTFDIETSFVDPDEAETPSDVEVNVEDLDIDVAGDGQVDLAEVVREQILLALPIQDFCKDNCLGLCQKCGANLNLIDCKCTDDEIDPRWEALKGLK